MNDATQSEPTGPRPTVHGFFYPVEPFTGPADALAESLTPLGIRLKQLSSLCADLWEHGRRVREIGDVAVYPSGRIVAWACGDATDAERVVLLRTAERVVTYGTDGPPESWEQRTTTAGKPYLISAVRVFPDGDSFDAAFDAVAQQMVDEQFVAMVNAGGLS